MVYLSPSKLMSQWRILAQQPPVCYGLLIHEVSSSHTTTHHSRQNSSGRVISSSQRPLPHNTQHYSRQTFMSPGGIRTDNLGRRAAANPRLIFRAVTGTGTALHHGHLFCRLPFTLSPTFGVIKAPASQPGAANR